MTTLSPELHKAFSETQYHVLHQAPFLLQVGQPQNPSPPRTAIRITLSFPASGPFVSPIAPMA